MSTENIKNRYKLVKILSDIKLIGNETKIIKIDNKYFKVRELG